MKTKAYSVRLKDLVSISDKAFKATSFDGSSDILPKSCVIREDDDVMKSDAWWIAAWILEKKNIQYSRKKEAWFDERGNMLPSYNVIKHEPTKIKPIKDNMIDELTR
ncbi:MAG: hypothetical protein ACRCZY_03665 [Phocaeicola sp.]